MAFRKDYLISFWLILVTLFATTPVFAQDDQSSFDGSKDTLQGDLDNSGDESVFTAQDLFDVYQVMHVHCAECHGGHLRRPKSGMGHILDLKRLGENEDWVTPGDPGNSELYLVMIDPDPDFVMPPPDSGIPPVPDEGVELVKRWIEAGAPGEPTDRVQRLSSEAEEAISHTAELDEAPPAKASFDLKRTFALAHPLLVHFPIALLLVGALCEGLVAVRPRWRGLEPTVRLTLVLGAFGALVSAASGWLDVSVQGYAPDTVFTHRWLGVSLGITATITAVFSEIAYRSGKMPLRWILRILLLAVVILVSLAGHTGGELVHGEGYLF